VAACWKSRLSFSGDLGRWRRAAELGGVVGGAARGIRRAPRCREAVAEAVVALLDNDGEAADGAAAPDPALGRNGRRRLGSRPASEGEQKAKNGGVAEAVGGETRV